MGAVKVAGADVVRFRRMWRDGMKVTEIAAAFDLTTGGVSQVARRLGCPKRYGNAPESKSYHGLTGGRWVQGPNGIQRWEEQ